MTEESTATTFRTWADSALDECVGLYDFPVPVWVEFEAVNKTRAVAVHDDSPPLVRYEGPDGSAVIQRGWDVWAGYSVTDVMENPGLKYDSRDAVEAGDR